MALKVGSTTIPTTLGSIKVGSTNVEKVVVKSGSTTTTVWEVNTAYYIIKDGGSSQTVTVLTHEATTTISDGLVYEASVTGNRVYGVNDNQMCDIDVYIIFPIYTSSYLNKSLIMDGLLYCVETSASSAASHMSVYLAVFNSSNEVVSSKWIGGVGGGGDDNPTSYDISSSSLTIPSSGNYRVGYFCRFGGSYNIPFCLSVENLYIK